jgi:hypothetical protein
MAKGDKIKVNVKVGDAVQPVIVEARQNGRNLATEWSKDGNVQWFVVTEVTRGGTTVSEARFLASEILWITDERKEA